MAVSYEIFLNGFFYRFSYAIPDSQEIFTVPTARLHGYDFSYQGLLGIWEGFAPLPVSAQPPLVDDPPSMTQSLLFDLPPTTNPIYTGFVQNVPLTASGVSTTLSNRRSRSPLSENWPAALGALAARRGLDTTRSCWKPAVHTAKLLQRQIALQVIGWSLRDDELNDAIKRWQKEGQYARAACWLVFTKKYGQAVELLMRSDG